MISIKTIYLNGINMLDKRACKDYLYSKLNMEKELEGLRELEIFLREYKSNINIYLYNEDILKGKSDYGEKLIKIFKKSTMVNKNINFGIIA